MREDDIRSNYSGATVYIRGKKVMDKGKILDFKWWKKKLKQESEEVEDKVKID